MSEAGIPLTDGYHPVPEAEADDVLARADTMIEELDELIRRRKTKCEDLLESWDAPNRPDWDEDFTYAQLDLQTAIDEVQALKSSVEPVLETIRDHNGQVSHRELLGG